MRPYGTAKSATAFRTISEVSSDLDVPQHVLRFWETRFPQIRPLKRGGGRRYYRPEDVELLRRIQSLLYREGYTIKGVQRLLKEGRIDDPGARPDDDAERASDDAPVRAESGEDGSEDRSIAPDSEMGYAPELVECPLPDHVRREIADVVESLKAMRALLRGGPRG